MPVRRPQSGRAPTERDRWHDPVARESRERRPWRARWGALRPLRVELQLFAQGVGRLLRSPPRSRRRGRPLLRGKSGSELGEHLVVGLKPVGLFCQSPICGAAHGGATEEMLGDGEPAT